LQYANKVLSDHIKKNKLNIKLFSQTREDGLATILEDFKEYKKPSILISPSIFEGVSLDDDYCRYIMFFKCPYYPLGDKRIRYIMNKYPDIYKKMAIYRIIQGIGRAVRNDEDYCDTFFLDGNLNKLFNSKMNIWKKEFKKYIMK